MRCHGAMHDAPLLRRPLGLAAGDNYSDFRVRVPGRLAGREEYQMPFKNLKQIIPLEGGNELLLGERGIVPIRQAERRTIMQFAILKEYFTAHDAVTEEEVVKLTQRALKRTDEPDIGVQRSVHTVSSPTLVPISDGDLLIG